jgi:nucleotide-binding universal stress UspA family protein
MSPQSILAVVTGEVRDRAVLDTARTIAEPEPAEIIVLHVKVDPQSVIPLMGDGLSGSMVGEVISAIERDAEIRAKQARSTFELWGRESGTTIGRAGAAAPLQGKVTAVWREIVGHEDDVAARLGRNTDLIVLARREDMPGMGTIEACLFNSGRPVLLAPTQIARSLGHHIGVLWNGSSQAARAVGDAIPLLRNAERVTVYTTGAEGPAPTGGDLARRLSRMGIRAVLDLVRLDGTAAGEALMGAAEQDQVDLIVMGGYGHSRFRELILGGVTRLVIERSGTAALLSH